MENGSLEELIDPSYGKKIWNIKWSEGANFYSYTIGGKGGKGGVGGKVSDILKDEYDFNKTGLLTYIIYVDGDPWKKIPGQKAIVTYREGVI